MSLDKTWMCDTCKSQNSFQNSKCKVCGQKIPESICEKIYKEELALQRKFLKDDKIKNKNEHIAKQDLFWKKYNASYSKRLFKISSGALFLKKARVVIILVFAVLFCFQSYFLKFNNLSLHPINTSNVINKISENRIEFREIDFSEKISVAKSRRLREKPYEISQFIDRIISEINEKKERIFNNGT